VVSGDPGRPGIDVDYPGLLTALTERAAAETGLPVLRVYWYDAAPANGPTREQRLLRVLDGVKLRLGKLVRRDDGKFEQKGVDTFLHADLTGLARKRAVADVVLVSGDEDLLHAVEEAQEYGTRIHLWGAASDYNQSLELVAADQDHVGDRAFAGQAGQVGVQEGVHTLLLELAVVSPHQFAQPQLHPVEDPQRPLLAGGAGGRGGVVPVHAQHGEPGLGRGAFGQRGHQARVVDVDARAPGIAAHHVGGGCQQISGVDQDGTAIH